MHLSGQTAWTQQLVEGGCPGEFWWEPATFELSEDSAESHHPPLFSWPMSRVSFRHSLFLCTFLFSFYICFFLCFFLRQGPAIYPWLIWNLLCRSGWTSLSSVCLCLTTLSGLLFRHSLLLLALQWALGVPRSKKIKSTAGWLIMSFCLIVLIRKKKQTWMYSGTCLGP